MNKYRKYVWPYTTMDCEEQKRFVKPYVARKLLRTARFWEKSGFSIIPFFNLQSEAPGLGAEPKFPNRQWRDLIK